MGFTSKTKSSFFGLSIIFVAATISVGGAIAYQCYNPQAIVHTNAFDPYYLHYSTTDRNIPTAGVTGYNATSRWTNVHFEGVTPSESNYIESSTSGEHYFYNSDPISGIISLEMKANGKSVYLAASYNPLTLNDLKASNRSDLLVISNFANGEIATFTTTNFPALANSRYFIVYANNSSFTANDITVNYSCDPSHLTPVSQETQTRWKTNEVTLFESVFGAGNSLPFISKSFYIVEGEENRPALRISCPIASSDDLANYALTLKSNGFSEINNGYMNIYQKLIEDNTKAIAVTLIYEDSTLTINASKNDPIQASTTWPSEAIATFFASPKTQSFPNMDFGSNARFLWTSEVSNNILRFTVSNVESSYLSSALGTLLSNGFVESPFSTQAQLEYANETTKSLVSEMTYSDETKALGFILTDDSTILSSFPTATLNSLFTNYDVNGTKYTQVFKDYIGEGSLKYRYSSQVGSFNRPMATVFVAGTTESELNAYIIAMAAKNYDLIVDPENANDKGTQAFNSTNYMSANYLYSSTIVTISFSINTSGQKYTEYASWSALIDAIGSEILPTPNNIIEYVGTSLRYFYNSSNQKVIVSGTNQAESDAHIASLLDSSGTFKGIYTPINDYYISTLNQDEYFPRYMTERINSSVAAKGSVLISYSHESSCPLASETWDTPLNNLVDSGLVNSGITNVHEKFPTIIDSSVSFVSYAEPTSEGDLFGKIHIAVNNATAEMYDTYLNTAKNDAFNFNFDDMAQCYINTTYHLGISLINNIESNHYMEIQLSYAYDYVNSQINWPLASEISGIPSEIANEIASMPYQVTDVSYYLTTQYIPIDKSIYVSICKMDKDYIMADLDADILTYTTNAIENKGYVFDGSSNYKKTIDVVEDGVTVKYSFQFSFTRRQSIDSNGTHLGMETSIDFRFVKES